MILPRAFWGLKWRRCCWMLRRFAAPQLHHPVAGFLASQSVLSESFFFPWLLGGKRPEEE
jgi:hypothetical protein